MKTTIELINAFKEMSLINKTRVIIIAAFVVAVLVYFGVLAGPYAFSTPVYAICNTISLLVFVGVGGIAISFVNRDFPFMAGESLVVIASFLLLPFINTVNNGVLHYSFVPEVLKGMLIALAVTGIAVFIGLIIEGIELERKH